MGEKDFRDDRADEPEKEGCAQDERRSGGGERAEDGNGDASAEYRIQGAHEPDHDAAAWIQDRIQHVRDRGILPQGDQRNARNQRNDLANAAQQSKNLAAEQD